MKRQSIVLLAVIISVASFGACQKNSAVTPIQSTEQTLKVIATDNETTISEINYITKWSIDELVQNIEINGKKYIMPFTVGELGDDYTFEKNTSEAGGYYIYYKDIEYGLIGINENTLNQNSVIISLTVTDKSDFRVGDFIIGADKEDITQKYGVPSVEDDNSIMCAYLFKENTHNNVINLIFSNDKLTGISIGYKKEKTP